MSPTSPSRLLHAVPTADLGALIGDVHALVLQGASDVDTAGLHPSVGTAPHLELPGASA